MHDQFHTDTCDYADIILPATTQLEHFDLHNAYGHLCLQVNDPVIAPLAEARSNNDVFRLLARAMHFEPDLFDITDEALARLVLRGNSPSLRGIDLERLRREGPVRLNFPKDHAPFAQGGFATPSGRCEFFSASEAAAGRDPLPRYTPPHEDPQTRPDLAAKYPLQMVSPPSPTFMNSTFVNIDSLRPPEPELDIHPRDAAARGIIPGQWVRVHNDRGHFHARAKIGATVPPGTVVTLGTWWKRYTPDGANCNNVTSTHLADMGGGATFFDILVEVEASTDCAQGVNAEKTSIDPRPRGSIDD